jgi:hypothetical protein
VSPHTAPGCITMRMPEPRSSIRIWPLRRGRRAVSLGGHGVAAGFHRVVVGARHTSVESLKPYTRISAEALGAWQRERDSHRR